MLANDLSSIRSEVIVDVKRRILSLLLAIDQQSDLLHIRSEVIVEVKEDC